MKAVGRLFAVLIMTLLAFQASVVAGQPPPGYVYLTFDDGPLKGSQKVDSIVSLEKVRINVFVVGEVMAQSPLLKSYFKLYVENPYIEVYNHSFSHAGGNYAAYYGNSQGVVDDVVKNETKFDLPYRIVRLPGANNWRVGERRRDVTKISAAAADLLAAEGYEIFGWDMEWNRDAKTGDPVENVGEVVGEIESIFGSGKMFTPGHLVILIHDPMFRKPWAQSELKRLIDVLQEKGYVFEHLRNYPEKIE